MSKSSPSTVKLENLILDKKNPRFAELYSGSDKEEDLIEYLLYDEAADEIAKGISNANEYYPDRPLWVLKDGNNYLVKDGNRRCAAVKALQLPNKYELHLDKISFDELPVLIYKNEKDLTERIRQEHTDSLFRKWERIAQALEVYQLFKSGNSIESMKDYDSNPPQLIKLASFYYEAVKVGKEDFKKLLRRKGQGGGRAIIFERLFPYSKLCGYSFNNSPSYEINISDQNQFSNYISAMVECLKKHSEITSRTIDDEGEHFFDNWLKTFGFNATKKKSSRKKGKKPSEKKGSVKHRPNYTRQNVPSALDRLINECYDLNQDNFANAKTALTRVSLECTLKYVIENTKHNGKTNISKSTFFQKAYYDKHGTKLPYTNFEVLKNKFTELIKEKGIRKALENFDLDNPHQIIHNYMVGAIPADAKGLCDNLTPLIEFLLQDENDLLSSLDLTKL